MKVLQVCKKFPYPVKDGESIAVTNLSKAISNLGCEVSLLAMNTSKHFYEVGRTPDALKHYREIVTVPVDNRVRPWPAFKNLFSSDSYHISRFVSKAFEHKLASILREKSFDIIQLETIYLAPYIPIIRKYSQAAIAVRTHNVEHEIWERITRNKKNPVLRWYLGHLTRKLRKFEVATLNQFDLLLPITSRDADIFRSLGYRGPATTIPIGLQIEDYEPDFDTFDKPPSLSFIGSLDWMPNQEGLDWFLSEIWPALREKHPSLEFHIAGRNMPTHIQHLRMDGVHVAGEVPCAKQFLNQHSILVVPLLSGSGMRAKILESMALGRVVITTSLGVEGIDARHGREVLIAEEPEEFAQCLEFCMREQGQLRTIGRQAREFVRNNFSRNTIAYNLMHTYRDMVTNSAARIRIS